MGENAVKKQHYPASFWLCCITFCFERFAFYGSKPILIVFLVTAVAKGGLGMDKDAAAIVAANLTAFTYLAPLIGGFISDRWLGARYAVSLGSILMGVGYLIGWQAYDVLQVNLMIAVVAIGTGLFKGNIQGIMGRLFEDQAQYDSGFSILYSFINIGAMLGSFIGGMLYLTVFNHNGVQGFREVFGVCGVLVILGGIIFTLSWKLLKGQGKLPFKYKTDENGNIIHEELKDGKKEEFGPLTVPERKRVVAIVIVCLISSVFWLFYYQQDIVLSIYMLEHVDMTLGGFTLSPAHVTTTWNGILCVVGSIIAAKIWASLANRPQGDMSMFHKVMLSFIFLGISYVVLVAMEASRGTGVVGVWWLLLFSVFLTVGELCFSPLGSSFISKYAPPKYLSVLLGLWAFATFIASKINGYTQAVVSKMGIQPVFITFTVVSFVVAALLFIFTKKLTTLLGDKAE